MINVQFHLQAPAPSELVSTHKFVQANLIVLQPPLINHISKVSDKRHDGVEPLMLGDPRYSGETNILKFTHEQLHNLTVKFGAGWEKQNASYQGYFGTVLKMEAFPVEFPPEYYETIAKAKSGDKLDLLVSVDTNVNLKLTIHLNGEPIPEAASSASATPMSASN